MCTKAPLRSFEENTADGGAGVYAWGDAVLGADVARNATDGWAGGVLVENESTLAADVVIADDHADSAGGLYLGSASTVDGSVVVERNVATTWIGGVDLSDAATLLLGGCRIAENRVPEVGGVSATVDSALRGPGTVANNQATSRFGGMLATDGWVSVSDLTISGNSAPLAGGAAAWWGATLSLSRVIVSANTATQDGGFSANGGWVWIGEGRVEKNVATSGGAAVGAWTDGSFTAYKTTWGAGATAGCAEQPVGAPLLERPPATSRRTDRTPS